MVWFWLGYVMFWLGDVMFCIKCMYAWLVLSYLWLCHFMDGILCYNVMGRWGWWPVGIYELQCGSMSCSMWIYNLQWGAVLICKLQWGVVWIYKLQTHSDILVLSGFHNLWRDSQRSDQQGRGEARRSWVTEEEWCVGVEGADLSSLVAGR